MAENSRLGHSDSAIVRSAALKTRKHGLNDSGVFSLTAISVDACDTTHFKPDSSLCFFALR
jgi:hypothetical protein